MKLLKPLLLGLSAIPEGKVFVTSEQHGRELKTRKYAEPYDGPIEPEIDLTNGQSEAPVLTSAAVAVTDLTLDIKQLDRGNWIIVDSGGTQVGEFKGTKAETSAELARLVEAQKVEQDPIVPPAADPNAPPQE
ncbi:hypothetical protein [Pseudomonas abietaniphila]